MRAALPSAWDTRAKRVNALAFTRAQQKKRLWTGYL